jgi:hypothetical protein
MTEPTVTYTWRIERLDVALTGGTLTNVVRKIHWRLFGDDGTNTLDLYDYVTLGDADPEDFTLFENLTEATVITWLEAAINARAGEGEPTVAQIRTSLAGMLAAKRTTSVEPMPMPWI